MANNSLLFDKIEEIKRCLNGYEFRKLVAEALTISVQGMTEALAAQITAAQTALTNLQQAISAGNVDAIGADVDALKTQMGVIGFETTGYPYKLVPPTSMTVAADATVKVSSDLQLPKGKYIVVSHGGCASRTYKANFHIKDSAGSTLLSSTESMAMGGIIEATSDGYKVSLHCNAWSDSGGVKLSFSSPSTYSFIRLIRIK